MKRLSSLIATLIVALVAFAQTPSATITMTIEKGQVILTPTPANAHVLCYGQDAKYLEYGTDSLAISMFVDDDLEFMYESAADIDELCPAGAQTICISDWMKGEKATISKDSTAIILAAIVAWDEEAGMAVRLSEVVYVDTIFTSIPTCGNDGPTQTIDPGKYYVSTFMDETTQYLLTTTTGIGVVLPATLYVDENTPKATHEFDFVAVEGQDACFNIKDNSGAFLTVVYDTRWRTTKIGLVADKAETGATWKVSVEDAQNHVTIENTDYTGDLHCTNIEGEIWYSFGTEATYNLPILTKVQGASTDSRETIINRQVRKTIENGQLILHIDGMRYNILGISLNH